MAVPVLLGLLASQGARAVATRIAGSSSTIRKVQNVLSKNFQKAQKESLSKGKIPTEKTLTQGLTKDQKGLLSNQGLLSTTRPQSIPGAPINQTAETQRQAGAAAFNRARGLDMLNKPIVQTTDAGLTGLQTTGLLGGLSVAPMFFSGGQPQPVMANAVGLPQVAQAPQEQLPRFGQVLRPSSESTSKEVINAALLKAGLTLLRGGTGTEALESAASVADSQTTYRTGAQALKAGQEALGKDAKISIYQRSDGSFGYQGTTQDTSLTGNSFFGTEEQTNNITKEQYDELVRTIKAKYPDATDQDIKDTLESKNIIYTGE
tara:strand:- start:3556 stop:4512 length:957 start_codon:yes stop_codon:yes gene_type:complete